MIEQPHPVHESQSNIYAPRVAVLLPVYNGERYLADAIDSIVNQTYSDFELLILDDGSIDSSPDIAQSYERRFPHVRYVQLPHRGLVTTLNTGMGLTCAEYIARIDSDDIALPERLSTQVAFLDNNLDIGAIGSAVNVIDANGRAMGLSRTGPHSREEFRQIRDANDLVALNHPTVMFRRAIAIRIGGYRIDYFPAEDLDLWNRMAEVTELVCVPDILLSYRLHPNAVTVMSGQRSMTTARRIKHNLKLRRSGHRELDAVEFDMMERRQPLWRRTTLWIRTRSEISYSSGIWMLASGQKGGVLKLGIAVALNPMLLAKLIARLAHDEQHRTKLAMSLFQRSGIFTRLRGLRSDNYAE